MNKNIKTIVFDEFTLSPKVGDRVSSKAFNGIESLGTVIYIGNPYRFNVEEHFDVLVKFDTWRRGHNGEEYYENFNLDYDEEDCSHWWFNNNELVVVGEGDE